MKNPYFEELILFENDDFIAINKPPGISTLEDRSETTNVLLLAKEYISTAQACHRIDKDTSGVLVLAKNATGFKHLSMKFQKREVNKWYHAVVQGNTEFDNYHINVPITIKNQGIVRWDKKQGKESSTYFTTLQNFRSYSLIQCKPVTGRRHQIRAHLKYVKHPIIADELYGGNRLYLSEIKKNYRSNQSAEKPIINRMALHAFRVSFKSLDGIEQLIEAPYPKDFVVLLRQLKKYNN